MNRNYGAATYTTRLVIDRDAGAAGLELYRETNGKNARVATLIFWDASGQFAFQTFDELPLEIVEELIFEAKKAIPTK